jgi:hypothetical protein
MNHDSKQLTQHTTVLQRGLPGPQTIAECRLPEPILDTFDGNDLGLTTRRGVIEQKSRSIENRRLTSKELRGLNDGPEKASLFRQIRARTEHEWELEQSLQTEFIPQHGPSQFIGPRVFFVSPLFRVCKENSDRAPAVNIELSAPGALQRLRYEGPELRQSDALIFMTLLNMLRDFKTDTVVQIHPSAVCKAIYGGYDGPKREKLKTHIYRLQKGLVIFERTSVQLCLRFDYPKVGPWSVSLDPKIVELFSVSPKTWLRMEPRLRLSNGLATWLFSFIEAQTRLIPMQVKKLLEMCGSESQLKPFTYRLEVALEQLTAEKIINVGWSIRKGELRWMKSKDSVDFQRAIAIQ